MDKSIVNKGKLLMKLNNTKFLGKLLAGLIIFLQFTLGLQTFRRNLLVHDFSPKGGHSDLNIKYICKEILFKFFSYISRPPILVNSSVVFLQFQANRQSVDRFEAAFSFHDGE